jgi:hypothetical protein
VGREDALLGSEVNDVSRGFDTDYGDVPESHARRLRVFGYARDGLLPAEYLALKARAAKLHAYSSVAVSGKSSGGPWLVNLIDTAGRSLPTRVLATVGPYEAACIGLAVLEDHERWVAL